MPPPVSITSQFSTSLCIVVYDDDVSCTNGSIGLVSPAVCLPLSIPAPQPRWSAASDAQPAAANGTYPIFEGTVGCRSVFVAAAEDANYDVIVHADQKIPPDVSLFSRYFCHVFSAVQSSADALHNNSVAGRSVLIFTPHHGSEGTQRKVCFSAVVVQTGLQLQQACALFLVQRCAVCIGGSVLPGSPPLMSLFDVSKQLLGDANWIRIWLVLFVLLRPFQLNTAV